MAIPNYDSNNKEKNENCDYQENMGYPVCPMFDYSQFNLMRNDEDDEDADEYEYFDPEYRQRRRRRRRFRRRYPYYFYPYYYYYPRPYYPYYPHRRSDDYEWD
jgi:hypothetical protein